MYMCVWLNRYQMSAELRATFASQITKSAEWRRQQLGRLLALVTEHGDELLEAVYKDLHKNKNETCLMELNMIKSEIGDHINHLDEWMAPQKVSVALINAMDGCQTRAEPLGTVLIIGAWNYPIQLTLVCTNTHATHIQHTAHVVCQVID